MIVISYIIIRYILYGISIVFIVLYIYISLVHAIILYYSAIIYCLILFILIRVLLYCYISVPYATLYTLLYLHTLYTVLYWYCRDCADGGADYATRLVDLKTE